VNLIIAIALAAYGIYVASYVPGMLAGPPALGLLFCFFLQAVSALVGAVGVWRSQRWAGGAVLLLGVAIAATSVYEGFVLGIVPYLRVVLVVVLAMLVTIGIAAYVSRRG
jgi:hypothetical protein